MSFWANVPHVYFCRSATPKAALALITRLESFLNFTIDTTELRAATVEFESKIARAVAENSGNGLICTAIRSPGAAGRPHG